MYKLDLTEEELQFIYDRCSNKAARLEESHLENTPCYRLSWIIMGKINEAKKQATEEKQRAIMLINQRKLVYNIT